MKRIFSIIFLFTLLAFITPDISAQEYHTFSYTTTTYEFGKTSYTPHHHMTYSEWQAEGFPNPWILPYAVNVVWGAGAKAGDCVTTWIFKDGYNPNTTEVKIYYPNNGASGYMREAMQVDDILFSRVFGKAPVGTNIYVAVFSN